MSDILLSINPQFVDKIISGEKKYEFRTRVAKKRVKRIVIYCTFPRMKILAEAEILGVLKMDPESLWKETQKQAGITKSFFDAYFKGRKVAYAYKLGRVIAFSKEKSLSDYGCKSAPQSFVYVKGGNL